jgi:rhodanese-related sulfurtransferase
MKSIDLYYYHMENQEPYYIQKLQYEIDSVDLFEALNHGEDIIVIDTRSIQAYQDEHIPGAINFPHRTMNEKTGTTLKKASLYVCYCNGIGCNGSTKGAYNLLKLGFNVKELIGGLEWWKRGGYETEGINAVGGNKISCDC